MALSFPNASRSYDPTAGRIRFWGHDGALEVPFVLDVGALMKLYPRMPNAEDAFLEAFDDARERIMAVASHLYAPSKRRTFYVLAETDF
jgi:hypothetical protein